MDRPVLIGRRELLQASGALCVAMTLEPPTAFARDTRGSVGAPVAVLTAYLTIARDGSVKVWSPTTEMGQGTHTAHAAIVADELGVDVARVSVETAQPADAFRRASGAGGTAAMSSGGSWGVRHWIAPLRNGAAQARAVLLAAAAVQWRVPVAELTLRDGVVSHPKKRKGLDIGALASAASKLTLPATPELRPASDYRFVGSELRRIDGPGKVSGATVYSSDFRRPGMLYACGRLSPVAGAGVEKLDATQALAVAGVRDVVALPGGAAVVANSMWAALRGAERLRITFTKSAADALDSAAISAGFRAALDAKEHAAQRNEDFDSVRTKAAKVVSADYEVPYLAHAPMEAWSCTVEFEADGSCDIWAPTQAQDRLLNSASAASGVAKERIRVHTLLLGGGFGRRLMDDGVAPAVLTAQAVAAKLRRPVKFFWDRGTEFTQARARPAYMARLTAALDADGRVTGVAFRSTGPSLAMQLMPPDAKVDRATFVDAAALQNLNDMRYRFGVFRTEFSLAHNHFPLAPWRAVGATQNAFFVETFIDEIARAANKDPLALRRELLAHDARALKVLEVVADRAGWGKPLAKGRARGLAYFESYGSLCAQIAEVSLVDGMPRVHRIVCALDCGDVVTPNAARAQVEGGIMQGLSAALFEAQTLTAGASTQRNFDTYRLLRIGEAPVIETHFVISREKLGGVGEPPLPPTAPAVANAVAVLRGAPVRRLPLV